jgi:predicted transposase YbfD/YdcC
MAIDGKALRGSAKCGATDAHLLSAMSQRLGVVLGQMAVPDKSNEITAIDDLLDRLVLTGWVVTTDAFFTQTAIAQTICDAGGDYLMEVKGNQPTLHGDLMHLFADADTICRCAEQRGLHSGRIERRVLRASTELTGDTAWPGMAQAVCVEQHVTHKTTGETHTQMAYAITSLAPTAVTPTQLLALWREHWHIENKLHWIRGCPPGRVTFDEDRATVRAGDIPQVMAALRSTAISVARLHGATNIAAACRRYAA